MFFWVHSRSFEAIPGVIRLIPEFWVQNSRTPRGQHLYAVGEPPVLLLREYLSHCRLPFWQTLSGSHKRNMDLLLLAGLSLDTHCLGILSGEIYFTCCMEKVHLSLVGNRLVLTLVVLTLHCTYVDTLIHWMS